MSKSPQIVTIKQARELLGIKAKGWSDAEVEDVINQLDFIAALAVRNIKKKLTEEE